MPYKQEIVCDIDATIFHWATRKEMLAPQVDFELLELLRGKDVLYSTARGKATRGFSNRPTPEQALQIIEEIRSACEANSLPMLNLHMDKPIGKCYIDDRGINPANFVSAEGDYELAFMVYNSRIFNIILWTIKQFTKIFANRDKA